jgi:ESCRT-II complex subunit VPS25
MDAPKPTPSHSDLPGSVFTKSYTFPPFFSLQPNHTTLTSQLRKWSSFIQRYCRYYSIHQLPITAQETLDSPLFYNRQLNKRLDAKSTRTVVEFMVSKDGDERAEYVDQTKTLVWIWWRKPEEWATLIEKWVDETGQRGTVLTLYELVQGETTESQEFYGLNMDVLQKALGTLVKKGRAQVFGSEDSMGVKIF